MRAVLLVLIALLLPAATAGAEEQTAADGRVRATFSYSPAGDSKYEDLHLRIERDGQAVHDAPLAVAGCEEPYCWPGGRGDGAVTVRDLDGDAEPEVLVDLYTGGAHCCVVSRLLRFDGGAYRAIDADWGDSGYELADVAGDARPEFRTRDHRFNYAFTAYAFSGAPLRVVRYDRGAFRDVTASARAALRADAAHWLRAYRGNLREGHPTIGALAAWAADQYRLGRRRAALRFVRREVRAGRARGDMSGRRFLRTLDRRLRAWGYARA